MQDWFATLSEGRALSDADAATLHGHGFVVIPRAVPPDAIAGLVDAYDTAVATAAHDDIKIGRLSNRVNDFVNRDRAFDDLYLCPPLLDACCRVIGGPFRLSSFHARSLRSGSPSEELHVDVQPETMDWPLVSFIFMIDEFRGDNGATRFVPGSHRRSDHRSAKSSRASGDHVSEVPAYGSAGSLLIFNGSVWHGHGANTSDAPRRSLQGAFIPRDGRAATNFAARMTAETRTRLRPLAQWVLGL